eukprot:TRINITY_DN96377_c0_g1_i1.p1 TRINITY_DN96377_c0_g1~~TRINITY_DN96377_c0_g1_i1.p1  ORF type:complete len:324 (+),score=53.28 TRINITY_DN96377_c0_g1_i1:87-1058(+)
MVDAIPVRDRRVELGDALLLAVKDDKKAEVARLLDAKADPLYRGKRGQTVLHDAAYFGRTYVIEELMRMLPEMIGAKDNAGQTALHCAAAEGNLECLQELFGVRLESPRDAGTKSIALWPKAHCPVPSKVITEKTFKHGWTCLHYAANNGHATCIELILQAASHDPELVAATNRTGRTALHFAAHRGHAECVEAVLQTHMAEQLLTSKSMDGHTPMHLAARFGHAPCIELLAEHAPHLVKELNGNGHPSLHEAGRHGHVDCVDKLITLGGTQTLKFSSTRHARTRGFGDIADVFRDNLRRTGTFGTFRPPGTADSKRRPRTAH